jgi:heme/copper-type cytochrome/quinol oxidase subunit 4
MTSHFGLMVLFGLFVTLVFALLMREDPREQVTFGAMLFAGFVGAGILFGWLLYALPL